MTPDRINTDIHDAATAWVVRADRGLTLDERRQMDAWLAADPRHEGAFIRAQAAWQLTCQSEIAGAAIVETQPALPSRRRALAWGVGAIAASMAAYFGAMHWMGFRYATEIGEVSQKTLADGSVVALDTASAIAARFDETSRKLRLERGQALFDVAKDATRPFIVEAGPIRVRAIGTAFIVRRFATAADVVVTEGTVAVWNVARPQARVMLTAGQSAHLADGEGARAEPHAMTLEQLNQRTAWRTGQIVLSGETLGYAASEFNRYNTDKIEIADDALAMKTLAGGFRASDPHGFATMVAALLRAKVHKSGNTITLSR